MVESQDVKIIMPEEILPEVMIMKNDGYRLVQIHSTRLSEGFEITYSFALDYKFENIRIIISDDTEIVSITSVYSPAFLYENEIKDLFGVKINHISLDYEGNLYRMDQKVPFN